MPAKPGPIPCGIEPKITTSETIARLKCSRRTWERMRRRGDVPKPDFKIGRSPRWKESTIAAWLNGVAGK
jgi:predicted DNA-binding transcriptional regulator AlpA